MTLASSFLTNLWSVLCFFFLLVYFSMLMYVVIDIFRRDDAGGVKKAAWLSVLLFFPLIGFISYTVTNGDNMGLRTIEHARRRAGATDAVAQIVEAKRLLDSGAINQFEFDQLKGNALAPAS